MLDFWIQDKMPEYYFNIKLMIWNIEKYQEEKEVGRRRGWGEAPERPGWGAGGIGVGDRRGLSGGPEVPGWGAGSARVWG